MWVLLSAEALAQTPDRATPPPSVDGARCPELYVVQFERFVREIDAYYREQEFEKARLELMAAEPLVPCIVEIVPPNAIAAYALRKAWAHALDVDEIEAERWAHLAKVLDPQIRWPDYVPVDHSAFALLELPVTPTHAVEGAGLVVPDGGGVFLDGRFLTAPVAELEVPHLLQVGDGAGRLVWSKWQDGAAFPADRLGPPLVVTPEAPRWFTHPGSRPKVARVREPWTDTRKQRLESALGFALAGGALYGSALLARSAYDARTTDGLFFTVNGITIASATAGGMSLGLLGAALVGR